MLVGFFLTSFWRISADYLKHYAHTSHDLPLKSDWSQCWTSKMAYVVHGLRSALFRSQRLYQILKNKAKSNSPSTKAQQFFSQNLYSVNIPNSLVLLLCFSSVLATAPDAALLWPLLPGDADWQTDEEGVVIKHAWSSTCLLLCGGDSALYIMCENRNTCHIFFVTVK